MSRIARCVRMVRALASGRVTWSSFWAGLRPSQVAVCCRGGGMMFCNAAEEAMFFVG